MSRDTVPLDRPRVNAPVVLALPGVPDPVRSRLEDLRGDDLVVAAVQVPGRVGVQRPGAGIAVTWAVPPRGVLELPCTLVEVVAAQPPCWVLRPVGPARRVQRRRYVRADVMAVAALEPAVGEAVMAPGEPDGPAWRVSGVVADLGEGGARVVVDAGQTLPVPAGTVLVVSIRLPAATVVTLGEVVALEPLAGQRLQVRLSFELSDRDAGLVRREVLRRQAEAHAAGVRR